MKADGKIFEEAASVFKVMGHPTRLHILVILAGTKRVGLSVKDIQECLEIRQPEASKHLIVMRNQGILKMEKRDGFSFYRINQELSYLPHLIRYLNNPSKK
jgi:DNA-binding transcriptional ArsR family regulator